MLICLHKGEPFRLLAQLGNVLAAAQLLEHSQDDVLTINRELRLPHAVHEAPCNPGCANSITAFSTKVGHMSLKSFK